MNRIPFVFLAAVAVGCTPAGSYQGKLVDGISGAPMPDVRLLAKSDPMASDMGCQAFEAMTGPDGSFTLQGLCAADTYVLQPSLTFMLLEGASTIDGSVQATTVESIKVWRDPGAGVYVLDGPKMDKQSTASDVEIKNILDSEEKVAYPAKLPLTFTTITQGQYLLVSGDRNIEKLAFYPLIESGERTFGTKAAPDKDEPWTYIGIEFTSDTEYVRKVATVDPTKILEIELAGKHVRYIGSDALPPGQYALWEQDGRRMYAVQF